MISTFMILLSNLPCVATWRLSRFVELRGCELRQQSHNSIRCLMNRPLPIIRGGGPPITRDMAISPSCALGFEPAFAPRSWPILADYVFIVPASFRFRESVMAMLQDGRVLIAGGTVENGVFRNSAELDPATGRFSTTDNMQSRRAGHSATLLLNGTVLIAGGLAGRVFEGGIRQVRCRW